MTVPKSAEVALIPVIHDIVECPISIGLEQVIIRQLSVISDRVSGTPLSHLKSKVELPELVVKPTSHVYVTWEPSFAVYAHVEFAISGTPSPQTGEPAISLRRKERGGSLDMGISDCKFGELSENFLIAPTIQYDIARTTKMPECI